MATKKSGYKFAYRSRFLIEGVFAEQCLENSIVSWIRTDIGDDPILSYTLVFKGGRCLCFRFLLMSEAKLFSIKNTFLTYSVTIGPKTLSRYLREEIKAIIKKAHRGWLSEERCISRVTSVLDEANANGKIIPLRMTKFFQASVYEDFYRGIDAWLLYKGQGVPIQIKIGLPKEEAKRSIKMGTGIPVWRYVTGSQNSTIIEQLTAIAEEFCKKRNHRLKTL